MPVLLKIKKVLLKHFLDMRWYSIVIAVLLYLAGSWLLLRLAGEMALTAAPDFLYWLIVTASTVGYGDLSPQTTMGKHLVAFFVIPFGLSLFALAVGRIAAFVSFQWRKGVRGLKALHYDDHILIIGWNEARTLQLLRLLLREFKNGEERKIALCVMADIENPLPDQIGFVKVLSFTHDDDMARAALASARSIIIDNADDDMTMTTALYCSARNPQAHIIAYFQKEGLGELLKIHCPNIECMPSVAVEMLAKSAVDPGSSALHHELLDVDRGMTQYSLEYRGPKKRVEDVFLALKSQYAATLIGLLKLGESTIAVNPALTEELQNGDKLYYIADERIAAIDWEHI
jgi:voltage-gated potassium channel